MALCQATTTKGNPCKQTARRGYVSCASHGLKRKYYIKIQQRCPYNGLYDKGNWRAYRKFSVWPLLFNSKQAAEDFMEECFTFKNLVGKKMNASVTATRKVFYIPDEEIT